MASAANMLAAQINTSKTVLAGRLRSDSGRVISDGGLNRRHAG
jgi:hypothetical protein